MWGGPGRHAGLSGELAEWWEGLWLRHTGSRVVLVRVPAGWGRSTVLDGFQAVIAGRDDAPVTLTARIDGRALRAMETAGLRSAAVARTLQVQILQAELGEAAGQHQMLDRLGLDKAAGQAQLGVGVAGLFFSGPTAGISFLLAGLLAGAAGKAWDDSTGGQDGVLARTARAVARVSAEAPVAVIIDDADCLDVDLAVTLVENLTARHDSQVLIIAATNPGSALPAAIRSRVRQGLTSGLVHDAAADPDMGYASRTGLVRDLYPGLPDPAVRRIAHATVTFADVFAVTAAPRLAELTSGDDEDDLLGEIDKVLSARLRRPDDPSTEAVVIAWAGGLLHAAQAARALAILGQSQAPDGDPDVARYEQLERVEAPASPELARQAEALAVEDRRAMAAAVLDEARRITADPALGLVEQMAAAQAAHHVRADLTDHTGLPRVQRQLAAALEELGESAAALDVAAAALGPPGPDRDWLAAAAIRLSSFSPAPEHQLLVAGLIAEATASGAGLGLEARIWAAVDLFRTGQNSVAVDLTNQAAGALDKHAPDLGTAADRWRLLLAFHAGRARHPALTRRLLAPLLSSGDDQRERAARAVLYAGAEPGADTRLQNTMLEAELAALGSDADDDRLRIHHVLAANYDTLGEYRRALTHAQHELVLRASIQSPDHPDTLTTRHDIGFWVGRCGDAADALRLFQELLPDRERVLGPDDPGTMTTRHNVASLTGACGDEAGALRLFKKLLPDQKRVLGPRHPDTLATLAGIASGTGNCGDRAGALRLFKKLLPDLDRVLGPDHPLTLTSRSNIASSTGYCGDQAGELRLLQELLPDQERVLGHDHPDTLKTRHGIIVSSTSNSGDAVSALRLLSDLLHDSEQALGPDHPDTLSIRNNIAHWTGMSGDAPDALRLFTVLLRDRQRVLGPDHPVTLGTRRNIATWTLRSGGDMASALRLSRELLHDLGRVLGPDHPDTLAVRGDIAACTGFSGNPAGAMRLYRELLPDRERVLGRHHRDTVIARNSITYWARILGERPKLPAGEAGQRMPGRQTFAPPVGNTTSPDPNVSAVWSAVTRFSPTLTAQNSRSRTSRMSFSAHAGTQADRSPAGTRLGSGRARLLHTRGVIDPVWLMRRGPDRLAGDFVNGLLGLRVRVGAVARINYRSRSATCPWTANLAGRQEESVASDLPSDYDLSFRSTQRDDLGLA
jgi:hypothetical protein